MTLGRFGLLIGTMAMFASGGWMAADRAGPHRRAPAEPSNAVEQAPAAPSQAQAPAATLQAPARAAAAPPAADDERWRMNEIRSMVQSEPGAALALIEAVDRKYPVGSFAEERSALRVDALVFADQIGLARDAAEEFLLRYPEGAYAEHIQILTGVHPRPVDAP